MVHFDTLFLFI
jgi:indole-3-glycerol phosphate synthase